MICRAKKPLVMAMMPANSTAPIILFHSKAGIPRSGAKSRQIGSVKKKNRLLIRPQIPLANSHIPAILE